MNSSQCHPANIYHELPTTTEVVTETNLKSFGGDKCVKEKHTTCLIYAEAIDKRQLYGESEEITLKWEE